MDKYEYKLRADEIKELIARGEYAQAAEIADTIDWRRVKSVLMLCTISDLYKINRRYADARNMLLLAYERRPGGRTICYSLCELSIKMEEYVQAVEYYKEFVQVAPKDSGRYILQYKLYEAQNVSLEERIEVLEELKKRDYREKWVYELAYLYHRMGLGTRCVEVCDEMIVWFGEGKYVIKAMELKMLHQPLTPQQQEKYDNRFNPQPAKTEMVTTDSDTVPEESVEEGADIVSDAEVTDNAIAMPDESDTSVVNEEVSQETKIFEPVRVTDDGRVIAPDEEFDIQVKTVDVGQYNTMNLQAELAEQLREVLGEESTQDAITRSILAPMLESDTESLDMPEIDEVDEEDLEDEIAELEESEVFFGETGEIKDISIPGMVELTASEQPVDDQDSRKEDEEFDRGGEQQPESSAIISTETGETPAKTFTNIEPPKAMAGVLSQEADGQLSLVMPDVESVEKQITGQMSIEDILAEWERLKKENEEKRREDVRQRVLEQTGSMFTEFEASLRDDILKEPMLAGDSDEVVKAALEAQESYGEQGAEGQSLQEEIQSEESAEEDIYGEAYAQGAIDEDPVGGESLDEEIITEEASAGIAWEAASEEVIAEEIIDGEMTEDAVSDEGVTEEEIDGESEDLGEVEELEEILEGEELDGIEFDAVDETADTEEEPVVEREKAKTRNLTKEERELFAAYAQNKKARDQLVNMIDNVSLAAYTGNVIVTGDEGIDTMTLAKNLIREVQLTDSNFSGKVAKISGNALNNKNVVTVLSDLNNGALIISKASEINQQTATVLNRALQQENQGIIIVFEDKKKDMDRFLKKYPELSECFTSRMDIEAMTNEALTNFGKQYAREREYFIDDMGALALQTRIELIQTSDHVATVMDVKEIVDEAIRNANRKSVGHFIDILTSKRYDDEDMIVLREKDFI